MDYSTSGNQHVELPLLLTSSAHMPPAPAWLISYNISHGSYDDNTMENVFSGFL
jgi:hypothetical protein